MFWWIASGKTKDSMLGTYMAYGSNKNGWWGEGEIKFFIEGDTEFPTNNGTVTEDYFNGAYDFDIQNKKKDGVETSEYTLEFSGPYTGLTPQVIRERRTALHDIAQRFGLYRAGILWILFVSIKIWKVTIQDLLGWPPGWPLYAFAWDDNCLGSLLVSTEPHNPFPKLPAKRSIRSQLNDNENSE